MRQAVHTWIWVLSAIHLCKASQALSDAWGLAVDRHFQVFSKNISSFLLCCSDGCPSASFSHLHTTRSTARVSRLFFLDFSVWTGTNSRKSTDRSKLLPFKKLGSCCALGNLQYSNIAVALSFPLTTLGILWQNPLFPRCAHARFGGWHTTQDPAQHWIPCPWGIGQWA